MWGCCNNSHYITQLKHDSNTGEILEIWDQPTGYTDAIAKDNRKCNEVERRWWNHWMQFHIGNSMLEMLQILNRNLVSVFQNTEKAVGWENILATTISRGIRETHRERFYSTVCYCLHCWWNMECRPCWHAAIQENGIKIIFEEGRQSEYPWVDKGKDFYNKHLKDLSDKYSIIM